MNLILSKKWKNIYFCKRNKGGLGRNLIERRRDRDKEREEIEREIERERKRRPYENATMYLRDSYFAHEQILTIFFIILMMFVSLFDLIRSSQLL